jgi:hypothetical protein
MGHDHIRHTIAVSNETNATVSVLLGNGDGSFQDRVAYGVGLWPRSVWLRDLNGDGWLDLTADNRNSNSISILLNRGDGSFEPKMDLAVSPLPWGHALGDLNKDGRLDLSVAVSGDRVEILLGNGDGTFQAPQSFATGGATPCFPVIADVDRDRVPDVIVAHSYQKVPNQVVGVLLGNGDGTLQSALGFSAKSGFGIAVGDLTNDRYPDIVATDYGATKAQVLINDGAWAAPMPPLAYEHSAFDVGNITTQSLRQATPRWADDFSPIVARKASDTRTPRVPAAYGSESKSWIIGLFTSGNPLGQRVS